MDTKNLKPETDQLTDEDIGDLGGDAACWAHLFAGEETAAAGIVANLSAIAQATTHRGPVWTSESEDLNVNLLVFRGGEGVPEHVNAAVDVLMIGSAGNGVVNIDGTPHALPPGHCVIVPKGARRSTKVMGDRFSYLTCHRRRAGLMPTVKPPEVEG
jgi:quercetin dioxygenase-like cupin family protein